VPFFGSSVQDCLLKSRHLERVMMNQAYMYVLYLGANLYREGFCIPII